jgi:hypothetical protein
MNARVKRVTAAQQAVREDGLIVVEVLKKRPIFDNDGKFTGRFIRRVIVERANRDWSQYEAAAERNEINERMKSGHETNC